MNIPQQDFMYTLLQDFLLKFMKPVPYKHYLSIINTVNSNMASELNKQYRN